MGSVDARVDPLPARRAPEGGVAPCLPELRLGQSHHTGTVRNSFATRWKASREPMIRKLASLKRGDPGDTLTLLAAQHPASGKRAAGTGSKSMLLDRSASRKGCHANPTVTMQAIQGRPARTPPCLHWAVFSASLRDQAASRADSGGSPSAGRGQPSRWRPRVPSGSSVWS